MLDISTTAPDEEHDNGRYNDNGATIQYAAVHLLVPFCGRNTLWCYTLPPMLRLLLPTLARSLLYSRMY